MKKIIFIIIILLVLLSFMPIIKITDSSDDQPPFSTTKVAPIAFVIRALFPSMFGLK